MGSGGGHLGGDKPPPTDDGSFEKVERKSRRNSCPETREKTSHVASLGVSYSEKVLASTNTKTQSARKEERPPGFGNVRSDGLYKNLQNQVSKDNPNSSQRGRPLQNHPSGDSSGGPPRHPNDGRQNYPFIGGQGGSSTGPKTLTPLDDGMEFENSCKLNFRHVREGEKRLLPTHDQVYKWVGSVAPDAHLIDVVYYCKETQEARVEYSEESEESANKLQDMLLRGIRWKDSNNMVTGYRMDKPTSHVRIEGVNKKVSKVVIELFMSQYGKVSSVYKKGIARDMEPDKPGFVWDGVWNVHLKVNDGIELPTLILVDKGNWRLKHRNSKFICYKCGSPSHPWWKCRALPRTSVEDVPEYNIDYGEHVDRIILPKFEKEMTLLERGQCLNAAVKKSKEVGRPSSKNSEANYLQYKGIGLYPPEDDPPPEVEKETLEVATITKILDEVVDAAATRVTHTMEGNHREDIVTDTQDSPMDSKSNKEELGNQKDKTQDIQISPMDLESTKEKLEIHNNN
ncbi:MAG: hypothetical protein GY782_06155, partial [Gammaproteobacteria bacterium]|nr:hypothetical protein [Gammaproteobacteria bacterium]